MVGNVISTAVRTVECIFSVFRNRGLPGQMMVSRRCVDRVRVRRSVAQEQQAQWSPGCAFFRGEGIAFQAFAFRLFYYFIAIVVVVVVVAAAAVIFDVSFFLSSR